MASKLNVKKATPARPFYYRFYDNLLTHEKKEELS